MHVFVQRGGSPPWVKAKVMEVYEDKGRKTIFVKYKCITPEDEVLHNQVLAEHPRNVRLAKEHEAIEGNGKKGKKGKKGKNTRKW